MVKTVGEGIVVEVERLNSGNSWHYSNMFEAEQEKYRPDQIQKLRGEDQESERGSGCNPLRG